MKNNFYSKENMEHVKESIQQVREGKVIQKTMEQLEAMEEDEKTIEKIVKNVACRV